MNDDSSKKQSETKWARLESITDGDIDYSDIPPLRGTLPPSAELREIVGDQEAPQAGHRVRFPLIDSIHLATPGDELTPERVAEILLEEEAAWACNPGGLDEDG